MKFFTKRPLDESTKTEMIKKNIWSSECPVSLDRLNLLQVSYVDFNYAEKHDGVLVVHDSAADHVLEIFKTLYNNKFPIAKIKLINDYDGNDEKSMEDNNTSAFNFRKIMNSNEYSIHSYGLAIDINPLQNPYLLNDLQDKKTQIPIFPPKGMEYINRINLRPGMVENIISNNESVVDIFKKHGFSTWGGKWNDTVDWHHFQTTREQAENIVKLSYQEGLNYFNSLIKK